MAENPEHILQRLAKLREQKANWISTYADVARFCNELENPYTRRVAEGARKKMPLDISGVVLAQTLAGNLFSNTVFQGSEWFSLTPKKAEGFAADSKPVADFLERLCAKAISLINASNFIQVYQEFLINYVVFGTGVFLPELDDDDNLVCRQFCVSNAVYCANDSRGVCDTLFRVFQLDARQAVADFGYKNVSQSIRDAFDKNDYGAKFKFVHAVYRRKTRDKIKRTPKNRAFASVYLEEEAKRIVQEDGYAEFPYMVPRFYKMDEEVYGRSPAMFALPTFRLLNKATEAYIRKEEFRANPLFFIQAKYVDRIEIEPGTTVPSADDMREPFVWDGAKDNGAILLDFIARQIDRLEDLFFKKIFQYLEDRKNMSATEAQLRYEEAIQAVSPVLSRLQKEFFTPFIHRLCRLIIRNKLITLPDGIEPDFEILYTTRLDTKLKAVLSANIINCLRLTGEAIGIIAQAPGLDAYFDIKEIVRLIAQNNNVSSKILNDDERIEETQAAAAQAQAEAQLGAMAKPLDLQKTPEEGSLQDALSKAIG